jgi:hypothetical protein
MQKDENSTIHRRVLLQRKIDRYTEETAELEIIKKDSVFFQVFGRLVMCCRKLFYISMLKRKNIQEKS